MHSVTYIKDGNLRQSYRGSETPKGHAVSSYLLLLTLLALTLSSCGGSGSSAAPPGDPQVSGNWQFQMSITGTSFYSSPLQGGFLVQKNGSITGQINFAIVLPSANGGIPTVCNSGTATVTGTLSGQSVNLTAVVSTLDQSGSPSTQTFALNGGALNSGNSAIQNGTYTVSAGYASGSVACGGGAQDAGSWSASLVPPLTGGFQGFFHSTTSTSFMNQDVAVSATFNQGPNVGAATATVTGTLLFQDPVTLQNDYACLTTATVNGTISGNSVLLQIFSSSGMVVGQIGQTPGSGNPPSAVTFDNTQGGYLLHNLSGAQSGQSGGGYVVTTKSCSGGDSGNLCLALGSSKACSQPITLTPFALTFPAQLVGSAATSESITLTNNSSSPLTSLGLRFGDNDSGLFYGFPGADFNGVPNFTEQDNCSQNGSISLDPGSSCVITVDFSPQESCPWLPQSTGGTAIQGAAPATCPISLTAALTVTVPSGGADADNEFSIPVTGTGLSRLVPSVPEIDFGAEAVGEASPSQTLSFTNQSSSPVTILPAGPPCTFPSPLVETPQPRPPITSAGAVVLGGIQIASAGASGAGNSGAIEPPPNIPPSPLVNAPTVNYFCDTDPPPSSGGSGRPNFQISHDGCSGQTLAAFGHSGNSCSLEITFAPQPKTWSGIGTGLDDFVQLNTTWCGDSNNPAEPNCEVDSGRFPVELKTNPPSSLRMSPSAGMDFGIVIRGTASAPLTITLFNDPVDPLAGTVNFKSKLITGADYSETDTCPSSLPSNQSCTITVTFIPTVVGLDPGSIKFTYNTSTQNGLTQTIFLRGTGQ
jgi:hypothetical protein